MNRAQDISERAQGGLVKISKRDREEAIEACLCRADEWIVYEGGASLAEWEPCPSGLAGEAFNLVHLRGAVCSTAWLEAAALLRDGWNPGDPVEVRR